MFEQIKLLSVIFLIILVPITNSFATSTIDSIAFYGKVISAIIDEKWDEVNQKPL